MTKVILPAGGCFKNSWKSQKPFHCGFLDEASAPRGFRQCVSLLSLPHGESDLVRLRSGTLRASRVVLALKAAWQSVTVQGGAGFRNCWGRARRCLAALQVRGTSQDRVALLELCSVFSYQVAQTPNLHLLKACTSSYSKDHFKSRKEIKLHS